MKKIIALLSAFVFLFVFSGCSVFREGPTHAEMDAYEEGYNAGLREGHAQGYEEGYEEGYGEGCYDNESYSYNYTKDLQDSYDNGYENGYEEGKEALKDFVESIHSEHSSSDFPYSPAFAAEDFQDYVEGYSNFSRAELNQISACLADFVSDLYSQLF